MSETSSRGGAGPRGRANDEVFVVGATGRVGSALVEELRAREVPVRAAVRSVERDPARPGVRAVTFDMRDSATWASALGGARRMFLMWPPGTSPKQDVFPFLAAARREGVERVAFLSVLGADRVGFLPHSKIEAQLVELGLERVILRAAYFMQNLSTTHAEDIRERDELFIPVGAGRLAMVDVRDVAEAAGVGLLDERAELAWDLTGARALSMDDVAAELSEALGRPVRYSRPGAWAFYRSQIRRGTAPGLARFMVAEYTHARVGLADRVAEGVREALGRAPTSFAEFARRERDSWSRGGHHS